VSNQDVSLSKFLVLIRWFLGIAACIALVLIVATLYSDWNNRRRAEAMLTLAKTLRVGESNVSDVVQAAGILRKTTDVRKGVDDYHMPIENLPLSACASTDCVFVFEPPPWDKRSPLLYRLQIKYSKLRKQLHWNTLSVEISTMKGVVQKIGVFAMSVDDRTAYRATTKIIGDKNASPWSIQRHGGSMEGPGEIIAGVDIIEIQATPNASNTRKIGALDFDLGCLRLTRRCDPCQLLPFACQDYEHGDWFYFKMSGDLLKEFQTAVNELPLGISEETLADRLGWGDGPSPRELFEDKLPYRFPDGTMFGDSDPKRLIYYVKKWREEHEGNSQDRTVTLVFDKHDRLAGVKSEVEGIRDRP
jgi:hypothetical protein